MALPILFYQCQKKDNFNLQNSNTIEVEYNRSNSLTLEEVPSMHNEFIDWYFTYDLPNLSNTIYSISRFSNIDTNFTQYIAYCQYFLVEVKGFDETEVINCLPTISSDIKTLSLNYDAGNPMTSEEFMLVFQNATTLLNLSDEFYDFMESFYFEALRGVDIDSLTLMVENEINYSTLTDPDSIYLTYFHQQLIESTILWSSNRGPDPGYSAQQIKCSTWAIIHDGIGGVLGSAWGPYGAIILGTAFSAYTNQGCP